MYKRQVHYGILGAGGVVRPRPVPLPLERIRRQLDPLRLVTAEHRCPVDPGTADGEFGQGAHHLPVIRLAPTQRANHHAIVGAVPQCRHQRGMWADLHHGPQSRSGQLSCREVEPHGVAQVAGPVARVEPGGVEPAAGDGGEKRDSTRHRPDGPQRGLQLVPDHVHVAGVGGVVHGQPPRPHRPPLAPRHELPDGTGVTGHHGGGGPVDHRQGQLATPLGDQPAHLVHGRGNGGHSASTGQRLTDQLGAASHHQRAVLKGQSTCDARGGHLALGMPDDSARLHTPRLPQVRQGHHHGPDRGLEDIDAVQRRRTRFLTQQFDQRPVDVLAQRLGARGHPRGEGRRAVQQPGRHSRPVRTLAGEHEGRPAALGGGPADHVGRGAPRCQDAKPAAQFLPARTDNHGPVPQRSAGRRQ